FQDQAGTAGLWDAERPHTNFSSQREMALRARLAQSEECVMVPNFLYNGSSSLPDLCEGPYAEVGDLRSPGEMDINNRPPAPLPSDAEEEDVNEGGDYAEVNAESQRTGVQRPEASSDDYVPVTEILKRKRKAQNLSDVSGSVECDNTKDSPVAEGSTLSLDLQLLFGN
ncbi:hypothetical protein BaRGS_00039491, partial [Batillaria attramentaria]